MTDTAADSQEDDALLSPPAPPGAAGSVRPARVARPARGASGVRPGGRSRASAEVEAGAGREARALPGTTDELLRVLIAVAGRVAVPEPRLRSLVRGAGKAADKYVAAYNLCDGTRGVREVGRITGIDSANLSRAISRWVDAGVVFKLGHDARPMHLYRLLAATQEDGRAAPADEDSPAEGTEAPPAVARQRGVTGGRGARGGAAGRPAGQPRVGASRP